MMTDRKMVDYLAVLVLARRRAGQSQDQELFDLLNNFLSEVLDK
jgi:hypothetical protein